ncbi:perlucin-like protein [Mizuhopecten yessoensis]|uniref:Hepatic lectin n=1 Tax=Mizuhopecten yessoensis TaxID=6573 RepID=A0A210QGD6_MIZYE|nr:perlucin-like protein [Mizuhopecten yessoensis]OWF47823.1 Hepatic lectin [Mizuhopecten yessoensis]
MGWVLVLVILLMTCTTYQQVAADVNKGSRSPQIIPGHVITEISHLVMSDWEYQRKYDDLITSLKGAVILTCGPGWVYFEDHCYWFSRDATSWPDARAHCQTLHGDLVAITGFQENRFVKFEMRKIRNKEHPSEIKYYFIGGTDEQREGRWIWIRTGQTFGFTDWASGEPNNANSNEDCLALSGESLSAWNDVPCQMSFYSICKKSVEYKTIP